MKPSITPIAIGATHTEMIVNMRGSLSADRQASCHLKINNK